MAGRPGRRAILEALDPAHVRVCRARAAELAAGVNTTVRAERTRAIRTAMLEGVWIARHSSRWFADAWSMRRRTVESDAHIALEGIRATTNEEHGAIAVSHVVEALEQDAELAASLASRVKAAVKSEEAKGLKDTADAYKAVAGERNRAAELLARVAGRLSTGPTVAVNIDARSVKLDAYAPDARAVVERAQAGDEDADRVARLLLASGATTLDELRDWLAPAVRALFAAPVVTEGT